MLQRDRSLSPREVPVPDLPETRHVERQERKPLASPDSMHLDDVRVALGNNPTVLMELDMEGVVLFLGKAWEQVVGTRAADRLLRPVLEMVVGEDNDKHVFGTAIANMAADNESCQVRFTTWGGELWGVSGSEGTGGGSPEMPQRVFSPVASSPGEGEVFVPSAVTSTPQQVSLGRSRSLSQNSFQAAGHLAPQPVSHLASQPVSPRLSREVSPESYTSQSHPDFVELVAQGVLLRDQNTGVPTHSMWLMRPYEPLDVDLSLPQPLVDILGFGAEIFGTYLQNLLDLGVTDMALVPPPVQVLCSICETPVPAWYLERHLNLCFTEHKAEAAVQEAHEALLDHRKTLVEFTRPVLLPSSSGSESPLLATPSYKTGSLPFTRLRNLSPMAPPRRFPLRTLQALADLVEDAISLNPPETNAETCELLYLPDSSQALRRVDQWRHLEATDPATRALVRDTEALVQAKVEALSRYSHTLRYLAQINRETDRWTLGCVEETLQQVGDQLGGHRHLGSGSVSHRHLGSGSVGHRHLGSGSAGNSAAGLRRGSGPVMYAPQAVSLLPSPSPLLLALPVVRAPSQAFPQGQRVSPRQSPRLSQVELVGARPARESPLASASRVSPLTSSSRTSSQVRLAAAAAAAAAGTASSSAPASRTSPQVTISAAGSSTSPPPAALRASPQVKLPSTRASPTPSPTPTPPLHSPRPRLPESQSRSRSALPASRPFLLLPLLVARHQQGSPLSPDDSLRGRREQLLPVDTHARSRSHVSPHRPVLPVPNYVAGSPMTLVQRLLKLGGSRTPVETTPLLLSKPPMLPLLVSTGSVSKAAPLIRDYEIVKPISKGAFGLVYLARRRLTGDVFAIKVLRKRDMIARNQVTNIRLERAIMMAQADSPFVARLYSTFQLLRYLYLVMEYMCGGDCAALLKVWETLPPEWALKYCLEMVVIVDDLHLRGIVHRDLKPDNFLIDRNGHLKLIDFGLLRMGVAHRQQRDPGDLPVVAASRPDPHRHRLLLVTLLLLDLSISAVSDFSNLPSLEHRVLGGESPVIRAPVRRTLLNTLMSDTGDSNPYVLYDPDSTKQFVGTPDYLAPETILGGMQTGAVDWWAIGCILFEFLCGYPPFHAATPQAVFANVVAGRIDWPEEEHLVEFMLEHCRLLVAGLLVVQAGDRLGLWLLQDIRHHPYFEGTDWDHLWEEKREFVPVVEDPLSTDYFDLRGADAGDVFNYDLLDEEEVRSAPGGAGSVGSAVLPLLANARPVYATSASGSPGLRALLMARPRRDLRLAATPDLDFGSFQFRNYNALDRSNKDMILRLKTEHLEHRLSVSSVLLPDLARARGSSLLGKLPIVSTALSGEDYDSNPPSPAVSALRPSLLKVAPLPSRRSLLVRLVFRARLFLQEGTSPSASDSEESVRVLALLRVQQRRELRRRLELFASDGPQFRRLEVALCEPDAAMRAMMEPVLAKHGCVVVALQTGDLLARKVTGNVKFDLVLTALKLPDVESTDVARVVRHTDSANSDTPFVCITRYVAEARASGAFDCVVEQPPSERALVEVLERFCDWRPLDEEAILDGE